MNNNKENIKKLIKDFLVNNTQIVFAYLFGSFVEEDKFNDIDLALYSAEENIDTIEIALELEKLLNMTIDIIDIKKAPDYLIHSISKGDVLIDGKKIKSLNLNELRESIGYVPQDIFLFSDTIKNNIAFGYKNKLPNDNIIEDAAKNAAVYSNIINLPKGFETKIGERGVTLSGGQKQRISIARAIIKSPKILIFDDCLSAVDTETENMILNNLEKIMKGKTSIIVSHRVSSVKNANKILVIENGKIIEMGTHQTLLNNKKSYYKMYQQQLLETEKQKAK